MSGKTSFYRLYQPQSMAQTSLEGIYRHTQISAFCFEVSSSSVDDIKEITPFIKSKGCKNVLL